MTFTARHQAGPGIVHGGLVGAALDEACGLLATWYRFPAVTARIFVRYRRPVPINRELGLASWVTGARGRRIHIDAHLLDEAMRSWPRRAAPSCTFRSSTSSPRRRDGPPARPGGGDFTPTGNRRGRRSAP